MLAESGIPGVFNLDGKLVVTVGTGNFAGAAGELRWRGLLDRREFPPDATALIGFVGTVTTAPEPATYGMMFAGLVAVAARRSRRSTP